MKKLLTRKNIIIALIVLAVVTAIYLLVRKKPLPEGLIQVNGRIEGDVVVVSSKYNGKITQLLVREGDNVKKGQLVVRLDDPETRARLAQAERSLDAAIARARSAGQNVGLTAETGGSSVEQARGQVAQATSDIEAAQAAAGSAAANVRTAAAAVNAVSASLRQAQEAVKGFTADVEAARANLQSSQKTVEAARAQAELSAENARRFTNLAREGVVTERQRDEHVTAAAKDQAALESAMADESAARAQVTARESELARSREQITATQAELDRARAQLAAAREEASAAQARVSTARGRRAQAQGILREALTSPTQVAISRSELATAQSQIREAQARVNEQRNILRSMYVISPIAGKVVTRIRDTGEVVTAGSPILEVVNLDKLYLKAYVPESQIGNVRRNLPAKVYVDAFPNRAFDATIRYISSTAEFTPKEVQTPDERVKLVYAVRLYLKENPNHSLTPGMPADAIIRWKESVPWQRPRY